MAAPRTAITKVKASTTRDSSPSGSIQLPMSPEAPGMPTVRLTTKPANTIADSPAAAKKSSRDGPATMRTIRNPATRHTKT